MTKKKPRKRRPADLESWYGKIRIDGIMGDTVVKMPVLMGQFILRSKDCRRMGKWMLRAADYLESKDSP